MRRPFARLFIVGVPASCLCFQACVADQPAGVGLGDPDAMALVASDATSSADGAVVIDAGPGDVLAPMDAGSDTGPGLDAAEDVTSDAPADSMADAAVDAPPPTGALLFDGVNDAVYVAAADGGANETAFTIETWFKTAAATGTFFEVYGSGADRFIFLLSGKVCFYVYASPYNTVCSTTATYNDGTWHHAAGTLGAAGGLRVYVDGTLAGSAALPIASTFTTDNAFALGTGHTGFSSAVNHYAGRLDEVRLWRVERSAAEISANYNTSVSPATAGLEGYWKLDEAGSTATAADETGTHPGGLSGFTFAPSPWSGPGAF